MKQVKACGFLIMRREPELSFLLMRHADRWDLPKGHLDAGESDLECALRELHEETGITAAQIDVEKKFLFETQYEVHEKRHGGKLSNKTLRIYLGWLKQPIGIEPSEHLGFEWFKWQPPHRIQSRTIDPLLGEVEGFLAKQ